MTNYKCIVTLRSGAHKIVRMTKDVVAHIVTEFRKMQSSIWNDKVEVMVNDVVIVLNECIVIKFINEYTGEEFLTVS